MSDDGASAVTVIGFVGSVFSPYYALARRRGAADPEHHVALNVAVYDRHGGWAMTERGRRALDRGPGHLAVGPSSLTVAGRTLTIAFDETRVPLPRRLRGRIRVDMPAPLAVAYPLDAAARHHWRPIAPLARMEVELDGPARRWAGDAYVDHNTGDEPLEDGFRSWSWSRVSDERGTTVLYDLLPRRGAPSAFRLDVAPDGAVTRLDAPSAVAVGRTGWRMPLAVASERAEAARVLRSLEDTPFYARSLVSLEVGGRVARGVHESLSLDRFRHPVVQMMLPFRMPRRA